MSLLTCEGLSPIIAVVATAQGLLFAQRDGVVTRFGPDGARDVYALEAASAMVAQGDVLLVVTADGEVGQLDGALAWTRLGEAPGRVMAITGDGRRHVVVVESARPEKGWRSNAADVIVLETGVRWELDVPVADAHLDQQGRLWLALDRGEFGGESWRLDLETGELVAVGRPLKGFVELPHGGVYGYGGLAHMVGASSRLVRLDAPGLDIDTFGILPLTGAGGWPITWADHMGGAIITSQKHGLFRVTPEPGHSEPLAWRGGRVFASAHVGEHLVLVGSTGVIADLDAVVHDYRCLDGSKPRRVSRRERWRY